MGTPSKIRIDILKPNPDNPRIIHNNDFQKLVNSIKEFPDMLEKRPLVIDSWKNPVLLAGNQRLAALIECGYQEIPASWVKTADGWTEDQKREFLIKDNDHAGMWDWSKLGSDNWNISKLGEWGLSVPTPKTVEDHVKHYTNDNCAHPLVPHLGESFSALIIVIDNDTDLKHLQEILGMGTVRNHKTKTTGQTFVTTSKSVIAKWKTDTQKK